MWKSLVEHMAITKPHSSSEFLVFPGIVLVGAPQWLPPAQNQGISAPSHSRVPCFLCSFPFSHFGKLGHSLKIKIKNLSLFIFNLLKEHGGSCGTGSPFTFLE
ncbi:hypothetical protein EK904_001741, partial [Melospiza melodia maxima]